MTTNDGPFFDSKTSNERKYAIDLPSSVPLIRSLPTRSLPAPSTGNYRPPAFFERGVGRVVQYTIRRKSPEPRTADAEWNVVMTRAQRSGKVERESESVEN